MKPQTADQLRRALLKRTEYPNTQKALADELCVSLSYLNSVIRGSREPGRKLLTALKLRRRVMYVPQ